MKTLLISILLCLSVLAAYGLAVHSESKTININNLQDDWTDFQFNWNGYDDQSVVFNITTNSSGSAYYITNNYCTFMVSGRVAGGTNITYISKGTTDCVLSGNSVTITIAYSNIPPQGIYRAELILTDTAGATVRTLGRGTILIRESLFAED